MLEDDPYVSELIDSGTSLRFQCPNTTGFGDLLDTPECGGSKTFGPREFIRYFGNRKLSNLSELSCPHCGTEMDYTGLVNRKFFMESEEHKFYEERILTDYLIKFVILASAALGLFGLSTYLPRQLAFIMTASVLVSATLIVSFITLFTFVSRFRQAVITFERNVKEVTISLLLLSLILAVAALFLMLLI
ncbi:MAG: hypothetical protein AAF543_17580 [Pseudomonadota bacterium]